MYLARLCMMFLAFVILLEPLGCVTPCRALSETICRCKQSDFARETCIRTLNLQESQLNVSAEEDQACSDILSSGSCTCENIANDQWEACGLAVDSP
jgi:hypothetical protein